MVQFSWDFKPGWNSLSKIINLLDKIDLNLAVKHTTIVCLSMYRGVKVIC